jgi:hypothetical protein
MKLHILFGQRRHEDTPEALEIMDEYSLEQNPEWMNEREKEVRGPDWQMLAVARVTVEVPRSAIMRALFPQTKTIQGAIK